MRTNRQCFITVKDGIVLDAGRKQPGRSVHVHKVTFNRNSRTRFDCSLCNLLFFRCVHQTQGSCETGMPSNATSLSHRLSAYFKNMWWRRKENQKARILALDTAWVISHCWFYFSVAHQKKKKKKRKPHQCLKRTCYVHIATLHKSTECDPGWIQP